MIDALLAVPYLAALVVAWGGNAALVAVAAIRVRQVPGNGWLWVGGAGLVGLAQGVGSPLATAALVTGARAANADAMIRMNAALTVAGAAVSAVWWALLVAGLVALAGGRARPSTAEVEP